MTTRDGPTRQKENPKQAGWSASRGTIGNRRREDPAATYRKTLLKIEQLHANLLTLERHCTGIREPETAFAALSSFKRLIPVFQEALSFIAIIETQTGELEEARKVEVEAQLTLLRWQLAKLHLATAEPLLRKVETSGEPLALGTKHLLERWLAYLPQIEERLALIGSGEEKVKADAEAIERVRILSRAIADRAPDLPDFSDPPPLEGEEGMPEGELAPSPVSLLLPPDRNKRRQENVVRLTVRNNGGRCFIEPKGSTSLMVEVRRHGLHTAFATVLGVNPANLVMVLNGRDPFLPDRLEPAVEFLKKNLTDMRVELLTC